MKIKPQYAVAISIIIVAIGILSSWMVGWWQTESDKTPPRLANSGKTNVEGSYDPAGIKGSFTFGEISRLFGIPLKDLADAFTVEETNAEAFKVKELETIFPDKDSEVRTSSVRLFTAWYKGLPYEMKEESFLPGPAVAILQEKAILDQMQQSYLDTHTYKVE